jgi:hypothetical protein
MERSLIYSPESSPVTYINLRFLRPSKPYLWWKTRSQLLNPNRSKKPTTSTGLLPGPWRTLIVRDANVRASSCIARCPLAGRCCHQSGYKAESPPRLHASPARDDATSRTLHTRLYYSTYTLQRFFTGRQFGMTANELGNYMGQLINLMPLSFPTSISGSPLTLYRA